MYVHKVGVRVIFTSRGSFVEAFRHSSCCSEPSRRRQSAVESEQSLPSTDDELKLRAQLDRVRETEQWCTAASRVR